MGSERKFSQDWISANAPLWESHLVKFKGRPDALFLEVGTYEGRTALWLLENILTNPMARLVCIDTFAGSTEHPVMGISTNQLLNRFNENLFDFREKIEVLVGESSHHLRAPRFENEIFDFVYIDGSHHCWDVLKDGVLGFGALKKGGILIFDDYNWVGPDAASNRPKIGVDAFLQVYRGRYKLLFKNHQVGIEKCDYSPASYGLVQEGSLLIEKGRRLTQKVAKRILR